MMSGQIIILYRVVVGTPCGCAMPPRPQLSDHCTPSLVSAPSPSPSIFYHYFLFTIISVTNQTNYLLNEIDFCLHPAVNFEKYMIYEILLKKKKKIKSNED